MQFEKQFLYQNSSDFLQVLALVNPEQSTVVREALKKQISLIQKFIYEEAQRNAPHQNTLRGEYTAILYVVDEHLEQVLSQLKEFVEQKIWNTRAIHLFKRAPDGIQKIRNLLADNTLDNFEKYNKLYKIIVNKCNNPSFFRKAVTNNFYQELLVRFHAPINFESSEKEEVRESTILNA